MSKCWCDDTPDKDLWHEDVNGCQTCYECSPSNVSHCIPHDENCEHYVSDAMQSEQQDSILQGGQRNALRNDSHLPECRCAKHHHAPEPWCDCDRLRACEQRVREEWYEVQSETWVRGFDVGVRAAREERMKNDDDYAYVAAQADADGRRRGWNDALDAVEAAVVEQKIVPLAKQRRFIITRNTKLWNDRQSWAEYGWWQFRQSALAAIDALREEQK